MKQEWKDPRIDVQKFIPNEYAASICVGFGKTGIIARLFQELTDGKNEKGLKDKGFRDDGFDFLTGGDDSRPNTEDNNYKGWYSNKAPEALTDKIVIHPSYRDEIEVFDGGNWGNTKTKDMASTVYFWGSDYSYITANNHTGYDVGPNASW